MSYTIPSVQLKTDLFFTNRFFEYQFFGQLVDNSGMGRVIIRDDRRVAINCPEISRR